MKDLLKRGNTLLTTIKLVTYILVSFLLISEYGRDGVEILALLIALLISNSFFRQEFLYHRYGSSGVTFASIVLEALIITGIGLLPVRVGYYVYLFFVTVSECTIVFPLANSIPVAGAVLLAMPLTVAARAGSDQFWTTLLDLAPSWIVSIVFVFAMSYIVKIQITEKEKLARTNDELEDTYRKLLGHMQRAEALSVEQERVRMSREIHDTLAHTLTAAIVQMEAAKKMISIDSRQAAADMENAQEVTREGLQELKRTIKALRPRILENRSLADAIRLLVQDQNLVKVDLHIDIQNEQADDPNTEVVLFRLLQETITNASRHGKADLLTVRMVQKDRILQVDLEDNGQGVGLVKKGFGLTGMQERIEKAGGTIQFSSQPGKGFHTMVQIPWVKEGRG